MRICRRHVRLVVQAIVSAVLIVWLFRMAPHQDLVQAWHAVGWTTLLLVGGCYGLAVALSVRRWQILLRGVGVEEDALRLTELYFMGLFCSLFLPTSAGGDAYRVYEVARRGHSTARVLLATLQDRLLSLGAHMLVGLVGICVYGDFLPPKLFWTVMATFALGLVAVAAVLHQSLLLRLFGGWKLPPRWQQWRPLARVVEFLRPLRDAPPLNLWRTVRVVGLAVGAFGAAVLMYAIVCDAVEVPCDFLALALVVSLVGMARMLPIAFGGVGVGEKAFVDIAALFAIGSAPATLVALVVLGVGTAMSLAGGLLLLRRKWLAPAEAPQPVLLPLPAAVEGGAQRHAA